MAATTGRRQDIFAIGMDKALWHTYDDGSGWQIWDSWGGVLTSAPTASWGTDRIDVYARGVDNAIWHVAWTAAGGVGKWESLGGEVTSGPAVTAPPLAGKDGAAGSSGAAAPAIDTSQFAQKDHLHIATTTIK